jgi:hypothetical protein
VFEGDRRQSGRRWWSFQWKRGSDIGEEEKEGDEDGCGCGGSGELHIVLVLICGFLGVREIYVNLKASGS